MVKDVELKEKLIERIKNTDNVELLEELSIAFGFDDESKDVYKLSPAELSAIKDGIEQIDNGLYFTNDEANKIIDKCLGR